MSERGGGLNERLITSAIGLLKQRNHKSCGSTKAITQRILDPATQLYTGWRYKVYRIRPNHELLRSGEAPTQRDAEKAGRRVLASVIRAETRGKGAERKRAA